MTDEGMRFYELRAWLDPDHWVLGDLRVPDGSPFDARCFGKGSRVDQDALPPLTVDVVKPGSEVDFNFAADRIPVVSEVVARRLAALAPDDVQLIPAGLASSTSRLVVLNLTKSFDCLDRERSQYISIAGRSMVARFKVSAGAVTGARLFRVSTHLTPIVVTDEIRAALQELEVRGIQFKDVT